MTLDSLTQYMDILSDIAAGFARPKALSEEGRVLLDAAERSESEAAS